MSHPATEIFLLINGNSTISLKYDQESSVEIFVDGQPYKGVSEEVLNNDKKKDLAHTLKRSAYINFLQTHFENLVVLSGAGTSVGCGGFTMLELWNKVEQKITPTLFEKFCINVKFISADIEFTSLADKDKNLEGLLSKASVAKEFLNKDLKIEETISICESLIYENCKISLESDSPHLLFLNKITNRKLKDPRVKIFTLNYDTLFEQAAIAGNFTIVDGFSFSFPRTLSGRNFDYDIVIREKSRIKEEDSFVSKVFHLYKPHGSVNWEHDAKTGKVIINENTKSPLMIFPKDSKYESSYEQPFFEMMARFQQNLRKDNVLLICLGFSFSDKHIVTAIKEAVTQNPSFRLLIVNRTIRNSESMKWFIDKAKQQFNITIVAEEFKTFTQNYPLSKVYADKIQANNDDAQ